MKMEKQKSISSLLFFEQTLLSNCLRYRLEFLKTYPKHSNGGKCVSEFVVF